MTATYAGHYEDPPRDGSGHAIPNATFQLYSPGTKNAPTYYTDRTKGTPVAGDPKSDALGNVSIWTEPGIYEYWYNGAFIKLVTVDIDDAEPQAEVNAAVAAINATLANYSTTTEMNAAIASGGGPTVGAELQANKNQINGYAGLNGSGVVANAQLPASATTGARTPTTHGTTHSFGDVDPIPGMNQYFGSFPQFGSGSFNASAGIMYISDSSGGSNAIALPTPVADWPPVRVKRNGASNVTVTGHIDNVASTTITLSINNMSYLFVPDADTGTWWIADCYVPLTSIARLDANNDFGGHKLTNYIDNVVTVTGSTYTLGTDGYGIHVRCTNGGGATITLPNNASIGAFAIIHQAAAGQVVMSTASGASYSEPDSFTKTAKATAQMLVKCTRNDSGTTAVWVGGGYTGA